MRPTCSTASSTTKPNCRLRSTPPTRLATRIWFSVCSTCWACSSLPACATWETKSSTGSTPAFAIRILAARPGHPQAPADPWPLGRYAARGGIAQAGLGYRFALYRQAPVVSASERADAALQEYGRLNKTIFILRYLLDEAFQRRIGAQINKGEALHALRGFLFVANEGKIRRHYDEEQFDNQFDNDAIDRFHSGNRAVLRTSKRISFLWC